MSPEATVDERVAAIITAAEDAAEEIRQEAERRMSERLAEAERAVGNRLQAAEIEAAEIVTDAREDGARLREAAGTDAKGIVEQATSEARDIVARAQSEADRIRMDADTHRETATSEALAVISRAQENADSVLREAGQESVRLREEATERSREMIRSARDTAGVVNTEGLDIVKDLRELGDSMRSNAARLLRDVQVIHSAMLDQIDKVDPEARVNAITPAPGGSARSGGRRRGSLVSGDDALDVPEFIPRT